MKNLILTLIITLPLTVWGQGWEQTYGGNYIEYGRSVQQTIDGGYIITGYTNSFVNIGDVYLIKTDENGNEQWFQTFGGDYLEDGYSVQQTNDGGYVITGFTESFGNGGSDIYLIKTDENGEELWSQTFGGGGLDRGYSVQKTTDGGYIITGYTNSFGNGNSDVYLIKTDENGNELWYQTFGGEDSDIGYSVQQTNDGGYVITGFTESFGNGLTDIYLIKTDENGNELWTQIFGGDYSDNGRSVQQTIDGGYIITGVTESFGDGNGDNDVYLLKIDENGNVQWSQTFGGDGNDFGYSVQQTTDGGYVLTSSTNSFGNGYNVYLIKTDENGNEQWSQTFGGNGRSGQQTTDGGYIITGYINFFGSDDIHLIKTDEYGNLLPYESTLNGCDSVQSLINETYIFENETYIDTLTNVFGGDSVVIQNLNIYNSPENIIIEGNDEVFYSSLEYYQITINPFSSTEWNVNGGTISEVNGNTIQVLWGDEGIGYVEVTETNIEGCSTTSTLEVTISNNSPVSNYYLNGCDSVQSLINETYFSESETYIDTLTNVFGGDSIILQEIEIFDSPDNIIIEGSTDVFNSTLESYQITINPNNSIEWNVEGETISEVNGNTIEVLWGDEGIGYVEVTETDNNGCSTTSTLEVTISNKPTNINEYNTTRKLIKTVNLLGQEIKPQKNQSYIEIYDDGTRKRKIIIE